MVPHLWDDQSSLQTLRGSYHLVPQISQMQLPDLLHLPLRRVNGVVYDGFPPIGFEQDGTYSWIYMPLIFQAANRGMPVIDLFLPEDLQPTFDDFARRFGLTPAGHTFSDV